MTVYTQGAGKNEGEGSKVRVRFPAAEPAFPVKREHTVALRLLSTYFPDAGLQIYSLT